MWPGFVEPSVASGVWQSVLDRFAGRRLPAAIRLNNMGAVSIVGNIEGSFGASMPGFVGTHARPANEGGYYAVYATPEHGVYAASTLLERYGRSGHDTPYKIVSRWSADSSIWSQYAQMIVDYLAKIGQFITIHTRIDLNDPTVRTQVLKAKSHFESGAGRPVYTDDVFARGVAGDFSGSSTAGSGMATSAPLQITVPYSDKPGSATGSADGHSYATRRLNEIFGPSPFNPENTGNEPGGLIFGEGSLTDGAGPFQAFGDWFSGIAVNIVFVILGLIILAAGLYLIVRGETNIKVELPA